ncbi:MAG: ATP-binding cassette domain-containing protein [Paracoccaceae bacterium]|nr:ATP-binding cassette domain-containing protein [Paracoccaceae bacterium]MDE2912926.1 ATP-binding cassette domain-containing protein [Paracoccaceae bacterium]
MNTDPGSSAVLSLRNIHKRFGGVVAIRDFSMDLGAGEIVALVGDNGAGKSTLVKVISGVFPPSSGSMAMDGNAVSFANSSAARRRGIEVVYQDLALANQQPVYMNLYLGRELRNPRTGLLDRRRMITESEQLVRDLDVNLPNVRARIRDMSGGQRQGVAIARATHFARKLILLDEPTAALGVAETAKVESIIDSLRARGLSILMISHSLDQVFRLADRITVLRRGQQVATRDANGTDKNEIVSMITGLH